MRALLRPGQVPIPNIAISVPTAYASLQDMQVWTTAGSKVYVAYRSNGGVWFLLHRHWPDTEQAYRVDKHGFLWAYRDRGYDYRTKTTLDDLAPTGEIATRCAPCGFMSLAGENRHSWECPLR